MVGFVIMPDHVHLLGDTHVSELMTRFKWNAGKSIRELRGPGRVWEKRFYDRTIRGDDELASAMRYIDWNPVRTGLCDEPGEYPFGSACAGRFPRASAESRSEGRDTGY